MPDFPIDLPAGYTVERGQGDELILQISLQNEEDFREIMTRESMFSFPSAAVGTVLAGPAGTVAGHVAGTSAGIIRHIRLHPDDDLTEPVTPGVTEDE